MLLAELEEALAQRLPVPTQVPRQWGWVATTTFSPATDGESPPRLTMTLAPRSPTDPELFRTRSAVVEYEVPGTSDAVLTRSPENHREMVATASVDGLLVRCSLASQCPMAELEHFLLGLGAGTFEVLNPDDTGRRMQRGFQAAHRSVDHEEGGWFRASHDEEEEPWWLPPDPETVLVREAFEVQRHAGMDPPSPTVWPASLGILSGTRFRAEVSAPARGLPFKIVRCRWAFQTHSDRAPPSLGISAWLRPASETKPRQPPPSGPRLGEWHLEYLRGDPPITSEELDVVKLGLLRSLA